MITVFVRTLLIYVILVVSMRFMGKRQVGELEPSELIVTIMLSELAASPILNKDIPFSYALVPILLLLSVEVILSFIILHSPSLKKLISGKPSYIIKNGVLDKSELSRQRLCLSELLCALRQNGASDISDVDYAILEENGRLSVFLKSDKAPATPGQLKIRTDSSGIAFAFIIDGKIIEENLSCAGWGKRRLERDLSDRNIQLRDVFLYSLSPDGSVTLIMKGKSGK